MEPIRIDVWSDIACPWCYIGKRRLEAGIRAFQAGGATPPVSVEFHSFELAPDLPEGETGTVREYLSARKGLPADQVDQMLAHVRGLAAAEGLAYDFDAVVQTRTLRAHELLHVAKEHGLAEPMKERLLRAYFVEGRDVGDPEQLVALAAEVGLDAAEVREALASRRMADAVAADIELAREYGIGGVPFFVVDGRYGISGAQPAELFASALARVVADRQAAEVPA